MQAIVDFLPAKVISFKGHSMEPARDIETLKEFHRVLRRSLRPPVYSVFCAIEDHAGTNPPDGLPAFTCFASDKTLADEAHVSRETVIRAIKELEGLNLVTVEDRQGYTCLIWPLVTNQGYITYMKEQAERVLLSATCNTEPQGVCQKATGGVSESHTNETKRKKPNNETNKGMAGSLEPGPTTIDLPDISDQKEFTQVLLPTVEAAKPDPVAPKHPDRVRVEVKPPKPKPKEPTNPNLQDPIILVWREIALENNYKYWPNKESQELLLRHIPPDQVLRFQSLIKQWLRKGHKITNIDGMVKVYWFGFDAFYQGQADDKPLPIVNREEVTVDAST
jgi:hypothetical protein